MLRKLWIALAAVAVLSLSAVDASDVASAVDDLQIDAEGNLVLLESNEAVPSEVMVTPNGISIGVDSIHGFLRAKSNFAIGTDYGLFRSIIADSGYTLVPLASFTESDLQELSALILMQPYRQNRSLYSADEMDAVLDFVTEGGGLLVAADGGGGSSEGLLNLNTLVAPFGVAFSSEVTDNLGRTVVGFAPHPVTAGVSAIGVDFQRSLTSITPPAVDLTQMDGLDDILAVVDSGDGERAVFVSDTSLWKDSEVVTDTPITFGDNARLLENILGFIAPRTTLVAIDVRPHSYPNSINPFNRGVIPVAILGSDTFDVTDIDVTTLRFGPDAARVAHALEHTFTFNDHIEDTNSDGFPDMITHYRTWHTGIACGDESANLAGRTVRGESFEGTDSIRTVGCFSRRGMGGNRRRAAEEPE